MAYLNIYISNLDNYLWMKYCPGGCKALFKPNKKLLSKNYTPMNSFFLLSHKIFLTHEESQNRKSHEFRHLGIPI